ncbi:hypothetical protein AQUCO_00400160v1 [Aquilegia coerulea]|uniref:Uncharacterized protein n=1 Tax=Aquilegia coerulea TaxID=218851 RepID=A0A2G5ETP5_AQUCA|nr:hypothetical protein AQUCO_00400160v1 [Aquilegia coerulea]
MPQVDLETLLRGGGGDAKVACETTLFHDDDDDVPPAAAEYYPAESFCLSKEDELDWFDRNVFYQRNESTKGNSNSNSNNHHANISHSSMNLHSNPHSQRFSSNLLVSKTSIIGLPKPHDSKTRRHVKPVRFLPKRLASGGKSSSRLTEPASPKVSCIGRVRSNRSRHKKPGCRQTEKLTIIEPEKTGFWSSFIETFWCSCRNSYSVDVEEPSEKSTRKKNKGKDEKRQQTHVNQNNPPGLGGLNRFVSGRRSDSWVGDVDDFESNGPPKVV